MLASLLACPFVVSLFVACSLGKEWFEHTIRISLMYFQTFLLLFRFAVGMVLFQTEEDALKAQQLLGLREVGNARLVLCELFPFISYI